jgi:predicted esterase YcpF (UPF0227 family)
MSLGGFWANYFAHKWNAPCVIVNPIIAISKRIGKYATSPDEIELVLKFVNIEIETAKVFDCSRVNVIVSKDDNVINYKETLADLGQVAFVQIFEEGGHTNIKYRSAVFTRLKEILKSS